MLVPKGKLIDLKVEVETIQDKIDKLLKEVNLVTEKIIILKKKLIKSDKKNISAKASKKENP